MLLKKKFKIFLFVFFTIIYVKHLSAEDCPIKSKIKVGILGNDFIDYRYYIYYVLDKYSLEYNVEYEFEDVKNNPDNFDIIFGEYNDLSNLSVRKISLPSKISDFLDKNQIQINNNLIPLDLDTFVLLSKKSDEVINFEDFSNFFSSVKYTLGMSFKNDNHLLNLLKYTLEEENINPENLSFESNMNLFSTVFKNSNKNLIESNYYEVFSSYENNENIFTLFNDGILLYKDIEFKTYQLFPKSKFKWDQSNGLFINYDNFKPYSFYGLSAYVNNTNNIGLVCYILNSEIRIKGFTEFNIQLSPFSNEDIYTLENKITDEYQKILSEKNKYIHNDINFENNLDSGKIRNIIFNKLKFSELYEINNYLN